MLEIPKREIRLLSQVTQEMFKGKNTNSLFVRVNHGFWAMFPLLPTEEGKCEKLLVRT